MASELLVPPQFCQYSAGACNQTFDGISRADVFFFYSSKPDVIADTIEEAAKLLRTRNSSWNVKTWRDLPINGQLIFCEICKAQRSTRVAVVDVTTMNFNLLFELGFALGLGIPVIPIRDTTCTLDSAEFEALGLIDTLGYLDFQNAEELAQKLPAAIASAAIPIATQYTPNSSSPLFLLRSPIATNGLVKVLSAIKKSSLRFRSYDPKEQPRLSLQDAFRQVKTSMGVCVYLLADFRKGATVSNARGAFVAGLALSSGAYVCVLQEGQHQQPIDYRDVVQSHTDGEQVQHLITPFIKSIYEAIQSTRFVPITLPLNALETLDLGDVAAENEINSLKSYFLPTAQYNDVKRGHARLVVGRKGAGKTAIFYGVRSAYWSSTKHIVLDLKPEGHQFLTLREHLLNSLSQGVQEHVLTAFWNYLLLVELAAKVIETDSRIANKHYERFELYDRLVQILGPEIDAEQGDFSERLLLLVERLLARKVEIEGFTGTSEISRLIYETDIRGLQETLQAYMKFKDGIFILIDNLDKSWPVNAATDADMMIIRSLMEATRKLQRQLAKNDIDCRAVVFIRNDIYEHLLGQIPDKGKDTAILLDWNDEEAFKLLIHRRMMASTKIEESFENMWSLFFEAYIRGEHSFSYILGRTMMRPRDLLSFLRLCINTAVNRGNTKVNEADILQAEKQYSEDQLQAIFDELRDINSEFADIPYGFIGSSFTFDQSCLREKLIEMKVTDDKLDEAMNILLWFGFIGIMDRSGEEKYSYMYQYGVKRMLREANDTTQFIIHPAFRSVLQCSH
ncbi:P-loop ATPase, Sll1717 family [Terriglobus sp. TAA 43]|uniref:P-loop ATPase, Sll1717 family n=1 Tax=Terriglobus sp. TAA 43 TaxID=278961 RepID=UPI0006473A58|nr:hypothetical protein [Terriglobus sp. TAA 43]